MQDANSLPGGVDVFTHIHTYIHVNMHVAGGSSVIPAITCFLECAYETVMSHV